MKKETFCFLLIFSVFIIPGKVTLAQKKPAPSIMAGIRGGSLIFFGDIGSMGIGYTAGISGSYALTKDISINFSVDYGSVSDSDEGTPNSARDYAFSSTIIEPDLSVMYSFFTIRGYGRTQKGRVKQWNKWTGIVFGGIALPWVNVTPDRHLIENDLVREKGLTPGISAGAALQYGFNNHWFIRLTLNPHLFFSDYIDGYTSPQSSSNDIYHRVMFGLFYQLHE